MTVVARGRSRRLRVPVGVVPAALFLLVFFVAPFVVLVYYSLLSVEQGNVVAGPSLEGYARLLSDPYAYYLFGRTIALSAAVTLLCLLFGYPVAYVYTRVRSRFAKTAILGSVVTPLLTSSLVLAFGWIVILGRRGFINDLLVGIGVLEQPVNILFTLQAVFIGMVQVHLPFMILPLIATLQAIPRDLDDSAVDLGATRWQVFWRITIPQSLPGIAAGTSLVFILSYTAFTIPTLMGGASLQIVSVYIWNNIRLLTWGTAAAYASLLLLTSLVVIVSLNALSRRLARWQYVQG
jgi:ABC-type spermidine/putrescine transport system permease subunit I